jgi:Zn-finger nucleic acid-binding protein
VIAGDIRCRQLGPTMTDDGAGDLDSRSRFPHRGVRLVSGCGVTVRTCPVRTIALVEMNLRHEEIDRCPSCNGVFFDQGKLKSVLRIVELLEHAELEEADIENLPPMELARRLECPAGGSPCS